MSEDTGTIKSVNMTDSEGKDVSYKIKEIENGYIISEVKSWTEDEKYCCEQKEYYSEEDPFAKESENMYDIMKSAIGEK